MGFEDIHTVSIPKSTTTQSVETVEKTGVQNGVQNGVKNDAQNAQQNAAQNGGNYAPKIASAPKGNSNASGFAARASKDLDFIDNSGFNNDALGDFLSDAPHMYDRPDYNEGADIEDGEGEPSKEPWYRNIFSKTPHNPEQLEQKIGGDMDGLAPKMGMQLSDMLFPAMIRTLKAEEDGTKYHANADQKVDLEAAWKYWLMTMNVRVTPGFYLAYIHGIIYGIPMMGGIAAYIQRVQMYGWHMPWSKSWKKKEADFKANMPGTRGPIEQPTKAPETAPVSAPTSLTSAPAPKPAPMESAKPAEKKIKKCLQTGRSFIEGEGFPKTSNTLPDLVDSFIDNSAWTAYRNANKLLGVKSSKTV